MGADLCTYICTHGRLCHVPHTVTDHVNFGEPSPPGLRRASRQEKCQFGPFSNHTDAHPRSRHAAAIVFGIRKQQGKKQKKKQQLLVGTNKHAVVRAVSPALSVFLSSSIPSNTGHDKTDCHKRKIKRAGEKMSANAVPSRSFSLTSLSCQTPRMQREPGGEGGGGG
jgi:hypothetical protein